MLDLSLTSDPHSTPEKLLGGSAGTRGKWSFWGCSCGAPLSLFLPHIHHNSQVWGVQLGPSV